jgi:hypothetical protein
MAPQHALSVALLAVSQNPQPKAGLWNLRTLLDSPQLRRRLSALPSELKA